MGFHYDAMILSREKYLTYLPPQCGVGVDTLLLSQQVVKASSGQSLCLSG